jgi:hypothetical protein
MIEWRAIDGHPDYEVSNTGRVRSWRPKPNCVARRTSPFVMQGNFDSHGYYRVKIRDDAGKPKTAKVHVLVCKAWRGPMPAGQVARHLDGRKPNNHERNLTWGTHKQNTADSIRHGTWVHGERHHSNKLTEAEVLAIKASPLPRAEVAELFEITPGMVGHIRDGRRWKHLNSKATP